MEANKNTLQALRVSLALFARNSSEISRKGRKVFHEVREDETIQK